VIFLFSVVIFCYNDIQNSSVSTFENAPSFVINHLAAMQFPVAIIPAPHNSVIYNSHRFLEWSKWKRSTSISIGLLLDIFDAIDDLKSWINEMKR
jgi:hypothetical protein